MVPVREKTLYEAKFDEKWKTYYFLYVALVSLASVIGIPFLPFWLAGLGSWYCRRFFDSLQCRLTERSLVVGRGIYFRVERTIPLDKIQDLTLREGPLLKKFGLLSLQIETAGQSAPQGSGDAQMVGLQDARGFRDRVLDQRDSLTAKEGAAEVATGTEAPTAAQRSPLTDPASRLVELAEESNLMLEKILQQLRDRRS